MFKPKRVIIPAAAGFVFSFLISIISIHKFPRSLLRGLIFGVIFGILGFLIDFLNSKFLSTGSNEGLEDDSSGRRNEDRGRGNIVDFTVDDENLTEDDKGPNFAVSLNKVPLSERDTVSLKKTSSQALNEEPAAMATPSEMMAAENAASVSRHTSAPADTEVSETGNSSGFKPINLGTKIESPSSGGRMLEEQGFASGSESKKSFSSSTDSDIDSLPEFAENADKKGDVNEIIDTSEFAQEGMTEDVLISHSSASDEASSNNHDASTIASAIRTLLKRDE